MPVQKCQKGRQPGYRWGEKGKCYTYIKGDNRSQQQAHGRAARQGRAISAVRMADVAQEE